MTREEAVNELNDRIKSAEYVDSDYIDCVSVDAVKMAISALSVLETNGGDTISRTAAIDVLEERLKANGYSNVALVSELNRSIGYLMELPSIQPERIGKWLDTYNDGDWHCSECGAIVEKDEQIRHYWQRCYHCGARMEYPE